MATGVCVMLSVCLSVCAAFNLDTSFPVMKIGPEGTLFGLSVALHEDLRTGSYLLLVGAPKEKAEPKVPANRTGGVYSCPITADQWDCRRMVLIHPDLDLSEDLVEDMWLGVTVASQGRPGGRVLVCGHRFVKLYGAFKRRHMIGQCYLRGNDLQYDVSDMQWQNPDQTCSHLGDVSGEVMCTMGISAFITQTEVIVGSPGSYEWQGNVHVSWMNPDNGFDTQKSSFANLGRRSVYIGYSVTQAARLLSEEDETIVTGAPKDSKDDARGSVLLAVRRSGRLLTQQTLRGEQTGSYYGNAVATADLNNDGWSDLLVGAPFYFQQQQEAGGAVYLYMNSGGRVGPGPSLVLRGPVGSAFGMSLAAAGDLDQDGFQDFAVGAPFHDTGTVMIWTGSSKGVSRDPSQVIRGSAVSPAFRTFGYSLSAGGDVDRNGYPDLLVGSLDDTVALLRTRPVVHLNQTLRVSPAIVDLNTCDSCVQVQVCFAYIFSSGEKSSRDNLTVHFTIAADITSLKPRLRFHRSGQSVVSGYLSMPQTQCDSLRVSLQGPIRDQVQPLVFSLNVSLYEKLPRKKNMVPDLKRLPVLSRPPRPTRAQIHIQKACGADHRCHSNLQMRAQFTDQNQNPITELNGRQLLYFNVSIKRVFLEVTVSNTPLPARPAEDAHDAVLSVSIPPPLIYSGVQTEGAASVQCSTEDAVLRCELGNPFRSNQTVRVLIKFQPSEISLDTREIRSDLQLFTLSEQSDLSPLSVSMLVDYSLQTSLTLTSPPSPAFFGGHVTGESAMKRSENVGGLLLFVLQVDVLGRPLGRLGNLEVEFDWPRETTKGKWLLYLTEIRLDGTSEPGCAPPGDIVNPLNLVLSERERRRSRRSLNEEQEEEQRDQPPPVLHLQGGRKKSYTLDCVHGASCVTFVCPLVNMSEVAMLAVSARLWSSTLTEDFGDARSVTVRVRATLRLRANKPTVHMEPRSSEIDVHVYPLWELQVDSGAPLWIVVVSVLAGVLLLALICLLLWKCGFFKRARTRERYQAKTQKARMKSQRLTQEL